MAWQWEGDWQLELTLDGQPLDHQGWMYAVDFPAQYCSKKQWKSCVRRRLWVRSRRYSAMNSWCAIAPLHKDATSVRFIAVRTTFRWSVCFKGAFHRYINRGAVGRGGGTWHDDSLGGNVSQPGESPRFIFTFRKSLV
jgi:hypothetical protein